MFSNFDSFWVYSGDVLKLTILHVLIVMRRSFELRVVGIVVKFTVLGSSYPFKLMN